MSGSLAPTTPSVLLTGVVAGALLLTGCADDDATQDAAPPTEDETSDPVDPTTPVDGPSTPGDDQPSPAASPEQPATEPVDTPALDARCEIEPELPEVEVVRYAVPSSWRVEGRCDILDPSMTSLPEATSVDAAIIVNVSDVEFGVTRESQEATTDRTSWLGARANLQAVRDTYTTTGAGMGPGGDPGTTWVVDLDAGTDAQGGVLTMSTGTDGGGDEYRLAQAVLDEIAGTVVVEPPAEGPGSGPGADGFAVLRVDGGGTPYAVTYDDGCFAFHPGGPTAEATDERCDLDPTADELVAGVVGDAVVGHGPPTAIAVQSEEVASPYGLATSIEGGTVFALPVAELPSTLTAIGPGGVELVTADVR